MSWGKDGLGERINNVHPYSQIFVLTYREGATVMHNAYIDLLGQLFLIYRSTWATLSYI